MRILIVGMGYVGMPLGAELVARGHEVHGLRRSTASHEAIRNAGILPLTADITRAETLFALPADYDCVVNCAATGGGGVEDYRRLYLEGTGNLIAWLARGDGKPRILYTSSTGVYGQDDGSLVDETSPTEPAGDTAKILVETERTLLTASAEGKISAVIIRAAGIYGPGRGYLLKQFLLGEARIEGIGSRILNMIHRDDLISVIITAIERGVPGEIYNAVDDEPVSQLEFFSWLAGKLGRPLPPVVTPEAVVSRKRGITNKRVSNHKLRSALGCELKYPTFREGYSAEIARMGIA